MDNLLQVSALLSVRRSQRRLGERSVSQGSELRTKLKRKPSPVGNDYSQRVSTKVSAWSTLLKNVFRLDL